MTVFVAFAEADRTAAQSLETFLERRGHFVEEDNGETALRPIEVSDAVVLLMSRDFPFAQGRLRLEQRALDAWAEGRLVLVKLDHNFAPVGLRDLPAIDATHPPQREFAWGDVDHAIRESRLGRAAIDAAAPASRAPASSAPSPQMETRSRSQASAPQAKRRGGGEALNVLLAAALLPGALAIASMTAIWLVNRIGPTPGTFGDLMRGVDDLGIRFGVPSGLMIWLFAAAILLLVVSLFTLISRMTRGRGAAPQRPAKQGEEAAAPAPSAKPQGEAVFVSYARANSQLVLPVIDAAKLKGAQFWLDREGIEAGDGWAGEIVRAIRGAREVMVMCSAAAFESDHVKREVYLADRYKKRVVPVFIEDAIPPEDFEYFFAGVQWLKLFETPEPERPAAVLRLLEAA
ncbi:MAG: toll/interleukin-1 receptor domain-containing protein [Pseudomonadota bacterium]